MIATAATAAMGLASGIMGGIKAGKQRQAMQSALDAQKADNQSFHDVNYYSNALLRQDSQNMIAQLRDTLNTRAKRSKSMGAITGATQEQQLAEREQDNNVITNVYRDVNARSQQYKDNVLARYQAQKNALATQQANLYNTQAQGGEQLMSNGIGLLTKSFSSLPISGK